MTASTGRPDNDEIARLAHSIWEAEGRPEGRDQEHWERAREILERGGREAGTGAGDHAARPVQPGFEDAPPGITPKMKDRAATDDLQEGAGGRFAKQLDDAPEKPKRRSSKTAMPGPRDPAPIPPTGPDGYAAVTSTEDAAPGALSDDPSAPPAEKPRRSTRAKTPK
jgi:hypothetical protein